MTTWSKAVRCGTQAAVVGAMCATVVVSPLLAEMPDGKMNVPVKAQSAPLNQQQKTLHALNRLTFGPRPGDEAALEKMGLEAWFQQQLNPAQIDDAAFEARMAQFPALKLSQSELLQRFPSPQMIRQMVQRHMPLPTDPVLHAVYADEEAFYNVQLKRQAAGLPPIGQAQPGQQQGQLQSDGTMASSMATGAMAGQDQPMSASGDVQQMKDDDGPTMAAAQPANAKGKRQALKSEEPMSDDDVRAVLALEPEQRFAKLVSMSPQEMIAFRSALKPLNRPMLLRGLTPEQMETVEAMQGGPRVIGAEAMDERLERDVYSERQLQAVMVDFWLNHFNVYARKNQNEPYYLPAYERDVILPNAMGKFENLLVATAKSSAMLMYLDNWESVGPDSPAAKRIEMLKKMRPNAPQAQRAPSGINENYARELMELHTLGVNGGYTQKDVQEVAKVFTGWTIDRPYQGAAGSGEAIFDETRHEPGEKVVLGKAIPEGGSQEAMTVLHMLATSPATARFISTKLAVRFVSDNPPQSLIDKMSNTFLKSDGDIKAVLTTMFHAPEFWAPTVYRAKVKTPIEFMASALRASEADVKNPQPLVQAMDRLGMPIYGMQTPNGYSWKQDEWISSNALISRMNFALVLSGDKLPGTQTNWVGLLPDGTNVMDPTPATEKDLEGIVLGESAAARTRATVLEQSKNPTAQQQAAQGFAQAKPVSGDMDDATMAADATAMKVRGKGGKGGKNGGQGFGMLDKPETPLDTMAGLLLGSPDFQRR